MSYLDSWREENRSAYLYRIVSDAESGTARQILFLELAAAADRQAEVWRARMEREGVAVPLFRPDPRARVVAALVRWLGVRPMHAVLAAMKVRGMSLYAPEQAEHRIPVSVAEVGRRHRRMDGGNLRAAVFGVNDGLVSNASLILGVAGASGQSGVVLLSGVAGLLAGAFSMAAGEYVSMRSQREMYEYQIALERDELDEYPIEEAAELALIFQAKGMAPEEARGLSERLIADPDRALDTLAREELGLNPAQLGSPWGAATFSFLSFAAGAVVPLLPFVVASGESVLAISAVLTAVALSGVGAVISLFTGRHAVLGGLRMLAIGSAAAGASFLIGKALGVTLA